MKKTSMFLGLLLSAILTLSAQQSNAQIGIDPIPPQQDPKDGCISASDMTEIAKYFSQFKNLSGKEYCNDESQTAYLLAGLNYIRKVQFSESMVNSPDELFTGKFAKDWFGYFTKRINKIQVETNCPTGVIAFVYGGFMADSTMHACPMALTNAFTALDLASVFLHEARHLDGFPHVMCSEGPRAGLQGACDKKISDGGSYAVTVETYTQLGQYGKDINPAFRAIAQASALIYGAEAFQQKVKINTEEAFLALTSDKKIYKIDSNLTKAPQVLGATSDLGHFIKSKMGLVIMPNDKNKQMVRVFPTGETQSMANEYNTSSVSDRQNVVDYYFAWTWNARIEKNKVRFFCDKREKPTQSVDVSFPANVDAQAIIYTEGYTPNQNYALVTTSQGLYKISCESGKGQIAAAQNRIDADILRVHKANNVTLALTKTGEVLNLSSQAQRIDLGVSNIVDITSYTRATFFDKQ